MASNLIVSAGTVPAATGHPWQGHLFYAAGDAAWWFLGVASASATTLITYRSPDLVTWTAKSTKAMAATLNGEGRNLCVVYKSIGGVDVVQCVYTNTISGSSHKLNTVRATIASGAITFGTEQLVVAGTVTDTNLTISGLGACFSDDNFLYIGLPDPTSTSNGDTVAYKASNADLGSSWTTGYAAVVSVDTSIVSEINSVCVTPLASHKVLLCYDNGGAAPPTGLKNVLEKTLTGTTISPTPASTAGNSVFTALGTAVNANNYGVERISDTDTHSVLRTGSNTFSHKRFNGTNWTSVAGASIPNQNSKADAGIFLKSDGTDLWLFVVDSDAANTIRYLKWTASGNAWDAAWTALETTTKTRKYLSGAISSDGRTLAALWSETNGSNFDVMVEALSLGGGTTFTKTLTATQALTALLARQARALRKATQGQAPFLVKRPQVTRKATQGQAAVIHKQARATRKATQSQVATLLRAVARVKTLLATQAQAAVLVRRAQAVRRATQAQTARVTRAVSLVRKATQAQVATLVRRASRTLRATQAQAAVLIRRPGRLLLATQGQTARLVRTAKLIRAATNAQTARLVRQARLIRKATQAQAATLVRQANRTLRATQAQVAVLFRRPGRTLAAVQIQTASLVKRAALVRRATQAEAARLVRQARAIRKATQTQAATVTALKVILKALSATQGQTARLVRRVNATRKATQGQSATLRRTVSRTLRALQTQAGTLARTARRTLRATQSQAATLARSRVFLRTLTAVQGQAATLMKRAAIVRRATQGQTATVRRAVSRRLLAVQGQAVRLTRGTQRLLRATQGQVASLVSRLLQTSVFVRLRGSAGSARITGRQPAEVISGSSGDSDVHGRDDP